MWRILRPMPCGGMTTGSAGKNAAAPSAARPFKESRRVMAIRARRVYTLGTYVPMGRDGQDRQDGQDRRELFHPAFPAHPASPAFCLLRGVMRAVLAVAFVAVALPAAAQTPNGEAIYRQHCAGCHNGSMPRMPSRDALKTLTPEHVETALSSFTMRRQGAPLSLAERRAVAEYVTGRAAGSYRAPLEIIPKSAYCSAASSGDPLGGAAWNGFGGDIHNTRFQPAAAAGLSPTAVPGLKLKWAFGFPGVSASGSQVTVAGSRAFVGSRNGIVYALDAKSGCIVWAFEADAGVRSSPVVGQGPGGAQTVFFGDAHAQVYALNAATGALRWKLQVDPHQDAMITGAVTISNGRVYAGVASLEEGTAAIPSYECCTFRGSVVSIDAASGKQIWK